MTEPSSTSSTTSNPTTNFVANSRHGGIGSARQNSPIRASISAAKIPEPTTTDHNVPMIHIDRGNSSTYP